MRILIVDQCSAKKNHPSEWPVYGLEEVDAHSRAELLESASMGGIQAGKLYEGRQQQFVGDAIDRLRATGNAVDRYFISAGFGLVEESTPLPVYDVTFADMTKREIDDRAERLEISPSLVELLESTEYDAVFLALGADYYRALDLNAVTKAVGGDTTLVLYNQEEFAADPENVVSIPARTAEAKELGTIVVALKGRYIQHFAANLGKSRNSLTEDEIVSACRTEPTEQKGLSDF